MSSYARLRHLVKQCKRRNGSTGLCPCRGACQAELEIHEATIRIDNGIADLRRRREEIQNLLKWLTRKPATVSPGWRMPPKPSGDYRAAVIDDGQEWLPHWYSETEQNDYVDFPAGPASWPFTEDTAYAEDWERLGFEVV